MVKEDGTLWTTSVSATSRGYSGSSTSNYYPTVTPIAANATWSQMTGISNVESVKVISVYPVFEVSNTSSGTTVLIQLFAVKKDGKFINLISGVELSAKDEYSCVNQATLKVSFMPKGQFFL